MVMKSGWHEKWPVSEVQPSLEYYFSMSSSTMVKIMVSSPFGQMKNELPF